MKVPKREYNNSGVKNDFHDPRGYIPKTIILNKFNVGKPLVVSKKLQLVDKGKHEAAVAGYENRMAYLDMADKYSGIMKKKKK